MSLPSTSDPSQNLQQDKKLQEKEKRKKGKCILVTDTPEKLELEKKTCREKANERKESEEEYKFRSRRQIKVL